MDDVGDKIMPSKHDEAAHLNHQQFDSPIIRYYNNIFIWISSYPFLLETISLDAIAMP